MGLFDKMIKQGMDSVVGKTVDQLKQKAGQTVQEQLADKAGALADKLAGQVASTIGDKLGTTQAEQTDGANCSETNGASLGRLLAFCGIWTNPLPLKLVRA